MTTELHRRASLLERLDDLKFIPHMLDGEVYYGGGVIREIKFAHAALQADDIDAAEHWCVKAEQLVVRRYEPGFRMFRATYQEPCASVQDYPRMFGRKQSHGELQ